jgi:putative restriction endonuclease
MNQYQRALQLWSLLALAARNQQLLSYELTWELTGLAEPGLHQPLACVHAYCTAEGLPSLTAIVISRVTGLPGEGFQLPDNYPDVATAQASVFVFDWASHGAPNVQDFEGLDHA